MRDFIEEREDELKTCGDLRRAMVKWGIRKRKDRNREISSSQMDIDGRQLS